MRRRRRGWKRRDQLPLRRQIDRPLLWSYIFILNIGFRLLSDSFQTGSLENYKTPAFRLVQIDSSDFILDFQISDWLQIGFRFISDCSLLKIVKTLDLRLVPIGSYCFILAS